MIVPEKHWGLSSNLPGVYVVKTHYPVAVVVWNAPRSDRRPLGKKTGCYGSLYFVCESVIFDIDGLESMIVHGAVLCSNPGISVISQSYTPPVTYPLVI
jgi:hypothetical protein